MRNIDMGNNEQVSVGIVKDGAGFLALTFTTSKNFKTYAGAVKWLAGRGFKANGERV
jgi:hypothetical protein